MGLIQTGIECINPHNLNLKPLNFFEDMDLIINPRCKKSR